MENSTHAEQMLFQANQLKERGNEAFRLQDFQQALKNYAKVFLYTKGLVKSGTEMAQYSQNALNEEQWENLTRLEENTYTNMAAVHFRLGQYNKAVDKATRSLEINSQNFKAYFRRGQAWLMLGDAEKAEQDINMANQLNPNDVAVRRELQSLKKIQREQYQSQKKQFKGFFDKLNEDS